MLDALVWAFVLFSSLFLSLSPPLSPPLSVSPIPLHSLPLCPPPLLSLLTLVSVSDGSWQVEGSLGGLHLLDVVPEGTRYQQVVSIGQGQLLPSPEVPPALPHSASPNTSLHPDMFKTALDDKIFTEVFPVKSVSRVACRFNIAKRVGGLGCNVGNASGFQNEGSDTDSVYDRREMEVVEASFDMASLCYIHCPKFLDELVDCVSEFRDYMTTVATSIRSAAAEVAMGMVGGRSDKDGLEGTSMTSLRREQSLGDITNTILLQEGEKSLGFNVTAADTGASPGVKSTIVLNARMETPIIVIPRKPNSPQVGDVILPPPQKPPSSSSLANPTVHR